MPILVVTWHPGDRPRGQQRITWRADHPAREEMEYFLRYSHTGGQRWTRVGLRTTAQEYDLDFDELPGGDRCLLAVVATDGINTTEAVSEPFRVDEKPCETTILLPIDGSRLTAGLPVTLLGQGFWLETGRAEREMLRWTSSVDGELGRGHSLEIRSLTRGEHEITLIAGPEGREGRQTVKIFYDLDQDSVNHSLRD